MRRRNCTYYFDFRQRAKTAFRAISDLLLAESFFALAFPPFKPPRRPKATAAGVFTLSGVEGVGLEIGWFFFLVSLGIIIDYRTFIVL